jgi:hypothetical protein
VYTARYAFPSCDSTTSSAPASRPEYQTWPVERGIGFEEIVFLIGQGHVLNILEHPNQRYGGQRIFVVQRDDYVYLVPFVEDDRLIALKTIIPSRKATKQYLEKEPDDHEA